MQLMPLQVAAANPVAVWSDGEDNDSDMVSFAPCMQFGWRCACAEP